MKPNPERLNCLAMIVCDDVYRDTRTGKAILVGAFHTINVLATPCPVPHIAVFFTLTNGKGDYVLKLKIEHERTGEPIVSIEGGLKVSDPLGSSDVDLHLHNLVFPEPGKYWVVLESDEEIIQQRPVWVLKIEQKAP